MLKKKHNKQHHPANLPQNTGGSLLRLHRYEDSPRDVWLEVNFHALETRMLASWRDGTAGNWVSRLPNPFNTDDLEKLNTSLSEAERTELELALHCMMERLIESLRHDLVIEDAIHQALHS